MPLDFRLMPSGSSSTTEEEEGDGKPFSFPSPSPSASCSSCTTLSNASFDMSASVVPLRDCVECGVWREGREI